MPRLVHSRRSSLLLLFTLFIAMMTRACPGAEFDPGQPGAAQPMPGSADAAAMEGEDVSWAGKVAVIEIKGTIVGKPFSDMPERVMAALDKADRDGAALVVLEIDSPGGEVGVCDKLSKRIFDARTPVVSLVIHKAVSGGAMVATAAREIVMTRSSRIGDIQPMQVSLTGSAPGMDDRTAEKIEVDIRTIMKVYAEHHRRPVAVVEAMVSRSSSLYQVQFDGGKTEYLTGHELEVVESNITKGRDKRVIAGSRLIKPEGKLLELSAGQAVEFGLASEVVENPEAFFAARGIDEGDVVRPVIPEGELDLKKLIPSMNDLGLPIWVLVLLGVFLIVGIAGVVTEFQAPGTGIPAAIGIIGFVCFFSVLFMHDRGSPLGIALFLIGVGLLVVEIMVLPGFGIAGITGILAILGGLLLAFTPDWGSDYMSRFMWHEVGAFTILILFGLVAALFVIWLVSTYGSKLPLIGRVFFTESADSAPPEYEEIAKEETTESHRTRITQLVGQRGVAETMLRPAGKVRLHSGELLDVVTDGVYVESGRAVRVVSAAPNRIVVAVER